VPFRALALLVLACLAPAPRALAEDGMSCDRGVVSVGDSRLDLLGKCGPPTLREARPAQVTEWVGDRVQGFARTVTITVETWTYDLGPGSLVRQARLEAGRLTGVRTGGYGRSREARWPGNAVPRAACEPSAIRAGDTTYDLLSRCGDPVFRDVREEILSVAEGNGQVASGASTVIVRETWTYDFGPRALVRYVEVREGGVSGVRTGGYGYSE
jgi:hypothetical protein